MKKAKIMLTALTVLAVVGSTLAFKAYTPGFKFYSCDVANNQCHIQTPNANFTTGSGVFVEGTVTAVNPAIENQPCDQSCPDQVDPLQEN